MRSPAPDSPADSVRSASDKPAVSVIRGVINNAGDVVYFFTTPKNFSVIRLSFFDRPKMFQEFEIVEILCLGV